MRNCKKQIVQQIITTGDFLPGGDGRQLVSKYPGPIRGLELRGFWQFDAKRSARHVLHLARRGQGNWDANSPFLTFVPRSKQAVSAFCGSLLRGPHDSQMKAQSCRRAESVKRLHTAKRMIFPIALPRGIRSLCRSTKGISTVR